jgi:large subunit ribosomal protein L30
MASPNSPAAGDQPRRLRITLVRSPLGNTQRHKDTVRSLGLRRLHQSVEQADTPALRGMVARVAHLVTVEELD